MSAARSGRPRAALRHPPTIALAIAAIALLTVGGAWAFQSAGYTPCELCLKERIPYYAGVPVALGTAWLARKPGITGLLGFGALILIFAAGTAMGLYHAGVEWGFWPGPTECSGAVAAAPKVEDFLQQLNHVAVTRCDEVALRVLGLSLAVWNAVISIGLVALADVGLLRSISGFSGRRTY